LISNGLQSLPGFRTLGLRLLDFGIVGGSSQNGERLEKS
jgi:hypothetical protein